MKTPEVDFHLNYEFTLDWARQKNVEEEEEKDEVVVVKEGLVVILVKHQKLSSFKTRTEISDLTQKKTANAVI